MANTVFFRRSICPAVDPIAFDHQLELYFSDSSNGHVGHNLQQVTTANVGIVDGMLVADFYLNDDTFGDPQEVTIRSIIANGPPDAGVSNGSALKITALILGRSWPTDVP